MSGPPLSEISIAMYPEFKLYSGQNRHDLYTLEGSEISIAGEKGCLNVRILALISPYQLELVSSFCLSLYITRSQDALQLKVSGVTRVK